MIKLLKNEIKYLKSLQSKDYMGDTNGTLQQEIEHCKTLIKEYEKA